MQPPGGAEFQELSRQGVAGPHAPAFQGAAAAYGLKSDVLSLVQRYPQLLQGAQQPGLPGPGQQLQGQQPAHLHQLLQQLLQRPALDQGHQSFLQHQQQPFAHVADPLQLAGYPGLQALQQQLHLASALAGGPEPPVPTLQQQQFVQGSEEVPFSLGPTGLKIRVVCNDVRGILYLDDQYISCFCVDCETRVRAGHDRPIFGLSRFEKHCGSKAKKWRTSLRVEPGSCPEVRPNDAPMPVGQYLAMKGVGVKGKGKDGNESDQEFMPSPRNKKPRLTDRRTDLLHGEDGGEPSISPNHGAKAATGNVVATLLHLRQESGPAGEPGRAPGAAHSRSPRSLQAASGNGAQSQSSLPLQGPSPPNPSHMAARFRAQQAQQTQQQGLPDVGSGGPRERERERSSGGRAAQGSLGSGRVDQMAPAPAGRSGLGGAVEARHDAGGLVDDGPAAASAGVGLRWGEDPTLVVVLDEGSIPVSQEWLQQQRQRFDGLLAAEKEEAGQAGAAAVSAKHAAIFRLVFGLLQGPNQRLFNEQYMPWLNDLPSARLDREFCSFASYLGMVDELPWKAVWRQLMAYLQGTLWRMTMLPPTVQPSLASGQPASPPHSPPLNTENACHSSFATITQQQEQHLGAGGVPELAVGGGSAGAKPEPSPVALPQSSLMDQPPPPAPPAAPDQQQQQPSGGAAAPLAQQQPQEAAPMQRQGKSLPKARAPALQPKSRAPGAPPQPEQSPDADAAEEGEDPLPQPLPPPRQQPPQLPPQQQEQQPAVRKLDEPSSSLQMISSESLATLQDYLMRLQQAQQAQQQQQQLVQQAQQAQQQRALAGDAWGALAADAAVQLRAGSGFSRHVGAPFQTAAGPGPWDASGASLGHSHSATERLATLQRSWSAPYPKGRDQPASLQGVLSAAATGGPASSAPHDTLPDLRLSSLMPQLYGVLGALQQQRQQLQRQQPQQQVWGSGQRGTGDKPDPELGETMAGSQGGAAPGTKPWLGPTGAAGMRTMHELHAAQLPAEGGGGGSDTESDPTAGQLAAAARPTQAALDLAGSRPSLTAEADSRAERTELRTDAQPQPASAGEPAPAAPEGVQQPEGPAGSSMPVGSAGTAGPQEGAVRDAAVGQPAADGQ